jgi:hypothetical protein
MNEQSGSKREYDDAKGHPPDARHRPRHPLAGEALGLAALWVAIIGMLSLPILA